MPIQVIKIKPEFVDERGYISRIIDQDEFHIKCVLYISRKAGSVGANHYHKKDAHYIYCLSGKIRYSEKNMRNENSRLESVILCPGDLVLSTSMTAHATEFLEDSTILAFTIKKRDQKTYEEDTVHIKIV